MGQEKLKSLVKRLSGDDGLMKKFENDPIGIIKSEGINPCELTPEILDKIESIDSGEKATNGKVKGFEVDGSKM